MNAPSLARSSLLTMGVLGLRLLTQASSLILAVRLFGPALYGNIAAASSLAVVLGVLPNLGAGTLLMRRIAHEPDAPADIWRYAWPQHLLLGLVLALLYVVLAPGLSHARLIPAGCWLGFALTEIVLSPLIVHLSMTLQALEYVPRGQLLQVVPLILRVLAMAACFCLPVARRLDGYVALQTVAAAVGLALALRVVRAHTRLAWHPRAPRREELRDGAAYAALNMVSANSMELDKVLALHAAGAVPAGLYASASRIVFAGTLPMVSLLLAAQPRLFRHAAHDERGLRRLAWQLALVCLAAGTLAALALQLASPWLIALFGPGFADLHQLLPVMAWAIPAMSLHLMAAQTLVSIGPPGRRLLYDLAGLLLLIALMPPLGRHLGVVGLGWGLLLTEASLALIGWLWVALELQRRSHEDRRPITASRPAE
ncbi:lipopolysaccharide biosynthesis protein [Frateuria aurantia]